MAASDDMLGDFRAKTASRRSGGRGPTPQGAVLSPASVARSPLVAESGAPEIAPAPPIDDGQGHMGSWADKIHPL